MSRFNDYKDAVSYIMSIPRFSSKNEYLFVPHFLEYMELVNEKAKYIHVAGTNGKGSTCAYISSICIAMNKKTGTFTSPHLEDIRERITVDGKMISKEDFLDCYNVINDTLVTFNHGRDELYAPSFFGYLYLIAMLYFKRENIEVYVIETGLGGRLDATNATPCKSVAVLTEIGFDHMEVLGNTIEAITREKCGILRPSTPVVFVDKRKESTAVITEIAGDLGCDMCAIDKNCINKCFPIDKGIAFSYESRYYNNVTLKIESLALYQVENAILALNALEIVFDKQELSLEVMQKGLLNMYWPGRMEEVFHNIFFDGAHNVDGIEMFLKSVSADNCKGRRKLLFSAVADKQAKVMVDMIAQSDLFDEVATGCIDNSRAISIEDLGSLMENIPGAKVCSTVIEAFHYLKGGLLDDDYLYVCGSLYMIGELKLLGSTWND